MDEADDEGADAVDAEGADGYELRRSTYTIEMSGEWRERWILGRRGHKPTFYEEYAKGRPRTLQEEVRNVPRTSPGMNEGTYAIRPAQCPNPHVLLTTGSRRASNASWSRWAKTVETMTPVPKCLSTKKRILGTCIDRHVAGSGGKETATRRRMQAQGCTAEVPYGAAVGRRSGHGHKSDREGR